MSDGSSPSPAEPAARSRRGRRLAGAVLLLVLALLLLLPGLLYLNRRTAARELLSGWLDSRGIASDIQIERLELDGFVGRMTIGYPRDPDFRAERVEVDYAVGLPWSKGGLGVTPSRIRLVAPHLRARYVDGRFSLGALDPLVEEFSGRPPRPDSRGPLILIERGRLNLTTDYGLLPVSADARINDGKLMRLAARLPSTRLNRGDLRVEGLAASADLTTTGDRVTLRTQARVDSLAQGSQFSMAGVQAELTGDLPYPDLKTRRGDGRAALSLTADARTFTAGQTRLLQARSRVSFAGRTAGWIDAFQIDGRSDLVLTGSIESPQATARGIALSADQAMTEFRRTSGETHGRVVGPARAAASAARFGDLSLVEPVLTSDALVISGRDKGRGAAFDIAGPITAGADRMTFDTLTLRRLSGRMRLDARHDGATLIQASGAMRAASGGWPLFGPQAADDIPELAEMKRALGDFGLDAPAFDLTVGTPGTRLTLVRQARITPVNGGILTVSDGARPLFTAGAGERGGGALTLSATRGRGLPALRVAVPDWALTPTGFTARLAGSAQLDFGVARGLSVTTAGRLTSGGGRLTFAAADCLGFTAETLELGENDAADLSGRLCPADRPLATVEAGGWRVDGRLAEVAGSAPFLAVRADRAEGSLAVRGSASGVSLDARILSARVSDATEPRRFNSLAAIGDAALQGDVWTAGFDLSRADAKGERHPVARLDLRHDGAAEAGGLTLRTDGLTFAEGGLQPSDLSPLAGDLIQSPAVGPVDFSGRFDWAADLPDGGVSSGRLSIPDLDFVSAAGPVKGLRGEIDFTSLAPLTTAPDQRLTVATLETVAPLTDFEVVFALDKSGVSVSSGRIDAAGGAVSIEPLTVQLDLSQPISSVIVVERVQLGDILAGAGFGEDVQLDAVVSGRIPFTYSPQTGVQISGGTLAAVQPGRLSIQREALTGLQANGGVASGGPLAGEAAVPPNLIEDLAYQAMQNLAFDTLSAEVDSLPGGRGRLLFRIKGRHDPPQRQEVRLTLPELISRRFLNRKLPLPSDTGIDLTLDTNLNLNQLVGDLLAVNRARNGE